MKITESYILSDRRREAVIIAAARAWRGLSVLGQPSIDDAVDVLITGRRLESLGGLDHRTQEIVDRMGYDFLAEMLVESRRRWFDAPSTPAN